MQANKGLRAFALSLAGACSLTGILDQAHAATTYSGDAVNYNFGTVQVQITVDDTGKITKIDTPQVSTRGSNASYTSYALPILVSEALKEQSAAIQGVSGASYLSRGWISSLASAIAQLPKSSTSSTPTPQTTQSPTPTSTHTASPMATPPSTGEGEGHESEGPESAGHKATPTPSLTVKVTPITTSTPTPQPTAPSTPPIVLKPGVNVIQKTITCVKGAAKKVVKALNPKCPAGYKLKKP